MGVGFILAAVISSAVSTAVNGRTFASFAIGMGIGIAAGLAAGAVFSNSPGAGLSGMAKFAADPVGTIAEGALAGALSGAASSAIYGGKTWNAVGQGALAGVAGVGVALGTEAALGAMGFKMATNTTAINSVANGNGGQVIQDLGVSASDPSTPGGAIHNRESGAIYDAGEDILKETADDYEIYVGTNNDWGKGIEALRTAGCQPGETNHFKVVYLVGHGESGGQGLAPVGENLKPFSRNWKELAAITDEVRLLGCNTATGPKGLKYIQFLARTGKVTVTGFDSLVQHDGPSIGHDFYSYGNLWKATPTGRSPVIISKGSNWNHITSRNRW